jgi:NitT/TauT family transport system ATP-binding protein
MSATLEVVSLAKSYPLRKGITEAIADVSFTVAPGEFVCIVGPSGCGKTTLLKCLAGLLAPSSGEVLLDGAPVRRPPPQMGFVSQDYSNSMLPWLRVDKNVTFPLRHKGVGSRRRSELASEALREVGLSEFARHYPWQLSGGMQQRVAIARALAYEPEILLMDEPFASVDAQTRGDLEDLLLEVWARYRVTAVFVTHDIDEAVYLADRVIVLSHRPSTVRQQLSIELPRPRDQITTKELPEFARLRTEVMRTITRPGGATSEHMRSGSDESNSQAYEAAGGRQPDRPRRGGGLRDRQRTGGQR